MLLDLMGAIKNGCFKRAVPTAAVDTRPKTKNKMMQLTICHALLNLSPRFLV